MNLRTTEAIKEKTSTSLSAVLSNKTPSRTVAQEANSEVFNPALDYNMGNIQVDSPSVKNTCPLSIPGPTNCPYGGACHTCPTDIQAKLAIGQPGDKYEQEADKIASLIVDEKSHTPINIEEGSGLRIQRQDTKDAKEKEKYEKALKTAGEAFLETSIGKLITEKAKELGEDFLSTLPGKIITGVVAASTVSAIVAKNAELPIQPPEIPLDKLAQGLSMKLTYEGPVQKPTKASIVFKYKFGGEKKGKKKSSKSKSERYREETAHMAMEQYKFRELLKTPEQKAEDEAFMQWYIARQTQDPRSPLFIPGLAPQQGTYGNEEKKEDEKTPVQRKKANPIEATTVRPSLVHDLIPSSGQPLDPNTRVFMESRFGHDFSRVRIHTNSNSAKTAQAINALAYTAGKDIVFGSGNFKPETVSGRRLLAHELTHVIQQENNT